MAFSLGFLHAKGLVFGRFVENQTLVDGLNVFELFSLIHVLIDYQKYGTVLLLVWQIARKRSGG